MSQERLMINDAVWGRLPGYMYLKDVTRVVAVLPDGRPLVVRERKYAKPEYELLEEWDLVGKFVWKRSGSWWLGYEEDWEFERIQQREAKRDK